MTAHSDGFDSMDLAIPEIEDAINSELLLALNRSTETIENSSPLATGRIVQQGKPISGVTVYVLARARRELNAPNARVHRGVQVPFGGYLLGARMTDHEGKFAIPREPQFPEDIANRGLYLAVDDHVNSPIIQGPLESVDGVSIAGDFELEKPEGQIVGCVSGFPSSAYGRCFVVAFNRECYLDECLVRPDGSFSFTNLNPGRYALRVATGVLDPKESGDWKNPEDAEREADPWSFAPSIDVPSPTAMKVLLDYPSL